MRLTTTMSEALAASSAEIEDAARLPMTEDEFRVFYDRTARGLLAYLARIAGDRQVADDLLQETYYRFCRRAATYESESHRRNTLYLIATNLVRDAARRKQLANMVPLEEDAQIEDHRALVTESRTDLTRALGQLKPAQRALLWMAYGHGASHSEIASVLGLKTASIKSLLFRARRRLAQLLNRS